MMEATLGDDMKASTLCRYAETRGVSWKGVDHVFRAGATLQMMMRREERRLRSSSEGPHTVICMVMKARRHGKEGRNDDK